MVRPLISCIEAGATIGVGSSPSVHGNFWDEASKFIPTMSHMGQQGSGNYGAEPGLQVLACEGMIAPLPLQQPSAHPRVQHPPQHGQSSVSRLLFNVRNDSTIINDFHARTEQTPAYEHQPHLRPRPAVLPRPVSFVRQWLIPRHDGERQVASYQVKPSV